MLFPSPASDHYLIPLQCNFESNNPLCWLNPKPTSEYIKVLQRRDFSEAQDETRRVKLD